MAFFYIVANFTIDIYNLAIIYLQLFFKKFFDVIFTITIFRYERTVIDKCRRKCGMLEECSVCVAQEITVLTIF